MREFGNVLTDARDVFLHVQARDGRNRERHQHTCNRSMHARLKEKIPHRNTCHAIERARHNLHPVSYQQDNKNRNCSQQIASSQMRRIAKGDNQNASNVIDHGKGGQENFQAQGHTLAEQAQHAQGKCDISRHGYRQASFGRRSGGHRKVNCHGDNHPSHRRDDGKQRLAQAGKFAYQHFTLDFQSHGKEEYRHQGIVDECHQRQRFTVMAEQVESAYL